jgi:hypothetical protein
LIKQHAEQPCAVSNRWFCNDDRHWQDPSMFKEVAAQVEHIVLRVKEAITELRVARGDCSKADRTAR